MTVTSSSSFSFSVVDAFTSKRLGGNPAAVIVLKEFLDDNLMLKIAREFNLSETAFAVLKTEGITHEYRLRWFSPVAEVALCGHATLATAHAIFSQMPETERIQSGKPLRFETLSGELVVHYKSARPETGGSLLQMEFPESPVKANDVLDRSQLATALGLASPEHIVFVGTTPFDIMVELDATKTGPIESIQPNQNLIAAFDTRAIIVTCSSNSDEIDFVSRCFAPRLGIPEDPVTGSAHCALAVHWSNKLGKSTMHAVQASERRGTMTVTHLADERRVLLIGDAVTVSQGTFFL